MNCLWKIWGPETYLADEHGEICFISKLHADIMETILVLKVWIILWLELYISSALMKWGSGLPTSAVQKKAEGAC